MSKTKYIDHKGQGFWVYDLGLGVFLKHLIDVAESTTDSREAWLSEAISSWRLEACIPDVGSVLDDSWSEAQKKRFVALAEEACDALTKRISIPAAEMEAWQIFNGEGVFPRGATGVHTGPVIELGQARIALVKGELPPAPDRTWWLFGIPEGRQALPMRRENSSASA